MTLVVAECLVLWLLIALVPGVNGQLPSPPWDLFGAAALVIAIVTVIVSVRADGGRGGSSVAEPSLAAAMRDLRRDPENRVARFELACALMDAQPDRALEEIDALLEVNPVDVESLALRGAIRRQLGDVPGTEADFDRALSLASDADRIEAILELRGSQPAR